MHVVDSCVRSNHHSPITDNHRANGVSQSWQRWHFGLDNSLFKGVVLCLIGYFHLWPLPPDSRGIHSDMTTNFSPDSAKCALRKKVCKTTRCSKPLGSRTVECTKGLFHANSITLWQFGESLLQSSVSDGVHKKEEVFGVEDALDQVIGPILQEQ